MAENHVATFFGKPCSVTLKIEISGRGSEVPFKKWGRGAGVSEAVPHPDSPTVSSDFLPTVCAEIPARSTLRPQPASPHCSFLLIRPSRHAIPGTLRAVASPCFRPFLVSAYLRHITLHTTASETMDKLAKVSKKEEGERKYREVSAEDGR